MRSWTGQIDFLGLSWEKNRLGRGVNLGRRGEIFASGAPNGFSRSSRTSNAPTHYTEEPKKEIIVNDNGHRGHRDNNSCSRVGCALRKESLGRHTAALEIGMVSPDIPIFSLIFSQSLLIDVPRILNYALVYLCLERFFVVGFRGIRSAVWGFNLLLNCSK